MNKTHGFVFKANVGGFETVGFHWASLINSALVGIVKEHCRTSSIEPKDPVIGLKKTSVKAVQ